MNQPNANLPPDRRSDRREFFLRGLGQALGGLIDALQRSAPAFGPAEPRSVLRPPGALPEAEFLRTCYRCGSCLDACPSKAIKPVQGQDEELSGTPCLDADLEACRDCPATPCVQACPSRALAPMRPSGGRQP